jgi:HEAT repeat protein
MNRYIALALAGVFAVFAVFAVQFGQIRQLKREISTLRGETPMQSEAKPEAVAPASNPDDIEALRSRLTHLEQTVAHLPRTSRIAQAENTPSEDELVRLQQRFADPATPDNERVRAIRTLRRSNKLGDDAVVQTLATLQTSTNAGIRRELLQSLEGSTNAALKQPLLAMLDTEMGDNGAREQVVNMLRRFADDPTVEAKLWDLALNDPNTRVRDQARDALSRAPATPERVEQLLNRASNPDASLDERLVSFRALRVAKSQTPELVADLGTLAQNTTDPIARAKLFKSFNGLTDPSLMAPLVNGLQDTDPVVRQNAANALSEFPDPRVQQWLTHLIQNDADPAVKREAHAALERTQRLNRKPQ